MNPDPTVFARHPEELFRRCARPGALIEFRSHTSVMEKDEYGPWFWCLAKILGRDPVSDRVLYELWRIDGVYFDRLDYSIPKFARNAWRLRGESAWLCAILEGRYAR